MHELNSSDGLPRDLPVTILRTFDAVANAGSFKAAAESLALTPSAVSHQMKTLEQRLGVALFRRQGRTVALTDAGEVFADHVRQGFMAFQRGILATRSGDRARQIRVSALELFSQLVLIPNLAAFAEMWPRYDVRIETTPRFADFDLEDLDIAIRVGDGRWADLKNTELLRITGAPVASPGFLSAHRCQSPGDLVHLRLIHDTAQPQAWRIWLAAQGVERSDETGDLWMDSAPAALHAAEQGLGVAFGIDPLVRAWPRFGQQLVLALPGFTGPYSRYWLSCRRGADRDPKIRAFSTWLRAACRDLA